MAYADKNDFMQKLMMAGGGNPMSGLQRAGQANLMANILSQQAIDRARDLDPLNKQVLEQQLQAARTGNRRAGRGNTIRGPDGRLYQEVIGPDGTVTLTPVQPAGATMGPQPGQSATPSVPPLIARPAPPPVPPLIARGTAPGMPGAGGMPPGMPGRAAPQGAPPGYGFNAPPPLTATEQELASHLSPEEQAQFVNGTPQDRARLGIKAHGIARQKQRESTLIDKTASTGGLSLTPAQRKADEEFAKEMIAYETGGRDDAEKGLGQLQGVYQRLNDIVAGKSTENLTGGFWQKVLPDFALSMTESGRQAIDAREQVEEVVQRNLRIVLGAQFTEKEGERLIARAYNPRLGEAENAARLQRLIMQIDGARRSMENAGGYYRQNGTLAGWPGRRYTMQDFLELFPEGGDEEPAAGTGTKTKVGRFEMRIM